MPSGCYYAFLLSFLAVFIISHCKLVEGNIIKIVTINNGSLSIICNLKRNHKENRALISWQKDGALLSRGQYTIGEDQAILNITNATVQDTGFYYLTFNNSLNNTCQRNVINEDCSCKRDVRVNITGCATNVTCNSVDLKKMNCSFKDSVCRFQNWMLLYWKSNKPPTDKHRIPCERKENDFIYCQADDTEFFLKNMSLWQLRASNQTNYSDFDFRFDYLKYVTFDEKPHLHHYVSNHSAFFNFKLQKPSYYEELHGSSNFIFKISIKEPGESKEILSEKSCQFDVCPDTEYNVSVAYRLKDTRLPNIWSESITERLRNLSDVPLPLPQVTDGCFKRLDPKSYRIFWKKVQRCYNAEGFVYLLKCGEKVLNKTRKHSFTVEDYHNQCQDQPIQIFTQTQYRISAESTSIYIPKKVLPVNQSLLNIFYNKSETKYHYELSYRDKDVEISNYTVFYCEKKTQYYNDYCAESGIDWLTLSDGTRSFELNISDQEFPKHYQFAISVQNGFSSSEMEWINCIIPLKIEGDQSVQSVQQVRRGKTWMLIQWHFPCEKRSKEVEGFVISWSSKDNGSSQNSSIFDWHQTDYKIIDLNEATNYSVTIETKLKGIHKSYAVTQYFMTKKDDPSSVEMWLTIFLALAATLFIGITIGILIKKYNKLRKPLIIVIPPGLLRRNSTQSNRSNSLQQTVILSLQESVMNTRKKESVGISNESLNNSNEFLIGINPSDSLSLPHITQDTSRFEGQLTNLEDSEDDLSIDNSMYDSSINNYKESVEALPIRNGYLRFAMESDLNTDNSKNDSSSSSPQIILGTSPVTNGYVRYATDSQDDSSITISKHDSDSPQMSLGTSPVIYSSVRFATDNQDNTSIRNSKDDSSSNSPQMPLETSPMANGYVRFATESQDDSSTDNPRHDSTPSSPEMPLGISPVNKGYVSFAGDSQNNSPIRNSKHDSSSNSPPVTLGTSPVTNGYVRFATESQGDTPIGNPKHDSTTNSSKIALGTSPVTNGYVRYCIDNGPPSEVESEDQNELNDNSKDNGIYAQIVSFSVGTPTVRSSYTQETVA